MSQQAQIQMDLSLLVQLTTPSTALERILHAALTATLEQVETESAEIEELEAHLQKYHDAILALLDVDEQEAETELDSEIHKSEVVDYFNDKRANILETLNWTPH